MKSKQILQNSWTNTTWYWDRKEIIEINIDSTFEWMTSLTQLYKEKYRNKHPFLEKLKITLKNKYNNDVDPIQYLYYLYYEEKLSTSEIYDRLYKIWDYNNEYKNTFELMFKTTFWWELRWNTEASQNTKRKQSINNWNKWKLSNGLVEINKERANLIENEIKFLFDQVKWKVDNLLLEDLENKKTLNEKIIYILYSLWFLKEENDKELAYFIKTLQERKNWFLINAKSIKWLIIKIKPELEKDINEQNLKKRLIERYNKYYKK